MDLIVAKDDTMDSGDYKAAVRLLESNQVFAILPGFYYHLAWYLELPRHLTRFGHGGNTMSLIWRRDTDTNLYRINLRVRHYHPDSTRHIDHDVFTWFAVAPKAQQVWLTFDQLMDRWQTAMHILSMPTGNKWESFMIEGDVRKFRGLPPASWMTYEPNPKHN